MRQKPLCSFDFRQPANEFYEDPAEKSFSSPSRKSGLETLSRGTSAAHSECVRRRRCERTAVRRRGPRRRIVVMEIVPAYPSTIWDLHPICAKIPIIKPRDHQVIILLKVIGDASTAPHFTTVIREPVLLHMSIKFSQSVNFRTVDRSWPSFVLFCLF